jgi:hypothetical protein
VLFFSLGTEVQNTMKYQYKKFWDNELFNDIFCFHFAFPCLCLWWLRATTCTWNIWRCDLYLKKFKGKNNHAFMQWIITMVNWLCQWKFCACSKWILKAMRCKILNNTIIFGKFVNVDYRVHLVGTKSQSLQI